MLKIRLRRIGAIRQPHYRIVVADARAPRDGRFFEILGHYNPRTDPPTINVDLSKYETWKSKGAQPTEAVERLIKQYNSGKVADDTQPTPTRTASRKGIQPVAAAPAPEAAPEAAAPEAAVSENAETAGTVEDTSPEPVLEAASGTPEGSPEGAPDTDTAS